MKIINIKNIEIIETVITQREISMRYRMLDDTGNILYTKSLQVKVEDLPTQAQTTLNTLSLKLLTKIESDEGL